MNHHGSLGPLADSLALLSRPPALIAFAVLAAGLAGRALVMAELLQDVRVGGTESLGLVVAGMGIAYFLLVLAVQFQLARRLGSDEPPTRPAELATWLGAALANGGAFWLITAIVPVIMMSVLGMTPYFKLIMTLIVLAARLALYPVSVLQAAAAHGDRELSLGKIWSFVTAQRPVWYFYVLLLNVAVVMLPALLQNASPPAGPPFPATTALLDAAIGAAIQLLLFLFSIATCRAARAAEAEMGSVFD